MSAGDLNRSLSSRESTLRGKVDGQVAFAVQLMAFSARR